MNYDQWSNYTALGYLKYALERYNKVAGNDDNEDLRTLTDDEVAKIIGCMHYAFDMRTLEEAYDLA